MCETMDLCSVCVTAELSSAVPDRDAYVGKSPPGGPVRGIIYSIPSDLVRLQEVIGGDKVLLNLLLKSKRISCLNFCRPKIQFERNKLLIKRDE